MPFRQPSATTIRQTNFRGKSCTFPVESVLPAESGGGQLQIEITDGYVLITSVNETPQDQQFIPYDSQTDGSWLARGTVTVTTTLASLINGTVTLREPQGEAMGIPIQIDPVLFIDTDVLSFDNTKPNETSSAVLTIRQQGAVAPIILTLDPPNQFMLADARQTSITTSTLTTTPTFEGSNVIVSYRPNQMGRHTAKLVATTPYDTKTVTLVGQTGGLLGWLPRSEQSTAKRRRAETQAAGSRGLLLTILLIALVGGLLWAGYSVLSRNKTAPEVASVSLDSTSAKPATVVVTEAPKPVVVPPATAPKPVSPPASVVKRPVPAVSKPKRAFSPVPKVTPARVTASPRVVPKAVIPKVAVVPKLKPIPVTPKPTPSRVVVAKAARKPVLKPVLPVAKPVFPKVAASNKVASVAAPKKPLPIPQRTRTKPHFTVIAGVFSSRQNAINQMQLLRKAGYSDAFVVAPAAGQKNLYKVAAVGSPDRAEAIAKMNAIRQLIKSNPWLLAN